MITFHVFVAVALVSVTVAPDTQEPATDNSTSAPLPPVPEDLNSTSPEEHGHGHGSNSDEPEEHAHGHAPGDESHGHTPGDESHGHTPGHGSNHSGPHGACECPDAENLTLSGAELTCSYDSKYHTCLLLDTCEHVHGHDEPPYVIFFIFFSFVLGGMLRYYFSVPPFNKIPYTILLFIIGVLIGLFARALGNDTEKYITIADMNPHLIMFIFLPILIFESAFSLDWHIFKKVLVYCLVLAGPGILVATGLTAVLCRFLFTTAGVGVYDWSWVTCILYGAIVSATDPVAVVALLKELGAPASIASLIEGESLLNDGTAIVLFNILKDGVVKGTYDLSVFETIKQFLWVAAGGPCVGLVAGVIGEWCLSKIFNDALLEITITVCCAYLTFFVAEGFLKVSGVLALVVLGVWLSHHRQAISPEVEHTLHEFWEMTVYLTNTLIFILVGLVASSSRFDTITGTDVGYMFLSYLIINLVRAILLVSTYKPLTSFAAWTLEKSEAVLVWWGGLRGAVGLALTLIIANDKEIKCVHPNLGTQFLFHVVGLVALTLVVNGVTAQFVVKYFDLAKISLAQKRLLEKCFNEVLVTQHDTIRELKISHVISDANWQTVNRYTHEGVVNPYLPSEDDNEDDALSSEEEARMAYFKIIKSSVWQQYEHGFIASVTIPRVVKFCERAKVIPGSFIQPDVLNKYWDESFVASKLGGLSLTLPMCRSQLSSYSTTWKENRWAAGFDVANCLVRAHEDVLDKIDGVVSDCKAANKIKVHCKSLRAGCFAHVQDLSKERVQISIAIQTRHAARSVLNAAREKVHTMKKIGQIDESDAAKLREIVEKKMNKLAKASSQMPATEVEAVIQDEIRWMHRVENACTQEFKINGRVEPHRKRDRIIDKENAKTSFVVIVSGVAKVRHDGKEYYFGTGECIGLSNLLCKTSFMTDVFADTDMKILRYRSESIGPWMGKYPLLAKELWKAAAVEAAFWLLSTTDPYKYWNQLDIQKFCETGNLVTGDQAAANTSILQAGMHHVLIKGSVTIDGETREGLQLLQGVSHGKVVIDTSAKILSINDPMSKEAKARFRWKKLRQHFQLLYKLGKNKYNSLADKMMAGFGEDAAALSYDSPLGDNRPGSFINSPTSRNSNTSMSVRKGNVDHFNEPLLNEVWKEMQPIAD
eukprot:TRINITY_DN2702_c0_g1_i1.p1 TRINITY_DN2702_c0_g1~~TRINITY_DN2702_c0_g1_i1.p1  ORF type:complete len:1161 (+),score=205.37 TRINITY_DN2702_c0_g1_i1:36-3518(+)